MLFRNILSRLGLLRAAKTATSEPLSAASRNKQKSEETIDITRTVTAHSDESPHSEQRIPTVGLRQELVDAFNEAFAYELKTMGVFSDTEISEMLSIINNSDHGFPNMGAWVKPIYEKYFNREWTWPVYDDFIKWRGCEPNSNKFEIFEQLVGYIHGKAISIDSLNFHKKYGTWDDEFKSQENLGIHFYNELAEEYGTIILKKNPDALPPFYPMDKSSLMRESSINQLKKLNQVRAQIFEKTFKNIINSLNLFSEEEISSMLEIINSVYDKHENDFAWAPKVYAAFFENREWTWPLYEEWLVIKRELDGDTKKRRRSPKKTIFKMLVRYIILTASRTETVQEAQKSGHTFKIRHHDAEEEKYANYFLKRNPDAMPPFYPGNESWLERIFS